MASHVTGNAITNSATVLVQYYGLSRMVVAPIKVAATLMKRHAVCTAQNIAFITNAALKGSMRTALRRLRVDTGSWTCCALRLKVAVGWTVDFYDKNVNWVIVILYYHLNR